MQIYAKYTENIRKKGLHPKSFVFNFWGAIQKKRSLYLSLFYYVVSSEYFLDFLQGGGNLLLGVRGHEAEAD